MQTTAWQHHFDVITTWILRSVSVASFTHAFHLGWWFRYLRLENMHCHHTLQSQNHVHIFLGLSVRLKGKWGLRLTSLHYHGVSNHHKIEILLKRFFEASMKETSKPTLLNICEVHLLVTSWFSSWRTTNVTTISVACCKYKNEIESLTGILTAGNDKATSAAVFPVQYTYLQCSPFLRFEGLKNNKTHFIDILMYIYDIKSI